MTADILGVTAKETKCPLCSARCNLYLCLHIPLHTVGRLSHSPLGENTHPHQVHDGSTVLWLAGYANVIYFDLKGKEQDGEGPGACGPVRKCCCCCCAALVLLREQD